MKPATSLKKFSISDREVLNKRVRTNPRYQRVSSRTNSGFNTQRRQELESEIRKYYKVRNDEVFRRISLADLVQLMVAHAEDTAAAALGLEVEGGGGGGGREEEEGREVPLKYRDELNKVVHGMDNLEIEGESLVCPYTLIDVRPWTQYQDGHLATATSHPISRLARAVGWENQALLSAKNQADQIIIVYDDNEDIAGEATSTLQHRGYTNVFMLSGGLTLAKDKFGTPLVTQDSSDRLALSDASVIAQTLTATVLPPLTLADAAEWWSSKAAVPNPSEVDSLPPNSTRSQAPKPKPWK